MLSNDDRKRTVEALTTETGMAEDAVFDQDVSPDELRAVAGGGNPESDCTAQNWRDIYHPSFPNCAATVEEGSWCWSNDSCVRYQVLYVGAMICSDAWT